MALIMMQLLKNRRQKNILSRINARSPIQVTESSGPLQRFVYGEHENNQPFDIRLCFALFLTRNKNRLFEKFHFLEIKPVSFRPLRPTCSIFCSRLKEILKNLSKPATKVKTQFRLQALLFGNFCGFCFNFFVSNKTKTKTKNNII